MPIQVTSLAEWEAMGEKGLLSIVIPAYNEEKNIKNTTKALVDTLNQAKINHEIVVINDSSIDNTENILLELINTYPTVRYLNNHKPNGFGFAVRYGLSNFRGDVVAIVMADGSDAPQDVVSFYHQIEQGYDCVFGTRFSRGGSVVNYPWLKYLLNRFGNTIIRLLFWFKYDDTTNAFKMYRRSVIAGLQPLLAYHFNLTVELSLKAIVRGYKISVIPNTWRNRTEGVSKFKIKEMGSRYFFIIFYCLIEKLFAMNDYKNRADLRADQLQVWHK